MKFGPCLLISAVVVSGACTKTESGDPAPTTRSNQDEKVAQAAATPSAPASSGDDNCDVTLEGPGHAKVGESGVATVSLRATGGYKLNQEAPFSVKVGESELSVAKKSFSIDDASVAAPEEVQMEIPFTADAAGHHDLEIHARFGVCSDDNCGFCRQKKKLQTVVD